MGRSREPVHTQAAKESRLSSVGQRRATLPTGSNLLKRFRGECRFDVPKGVFHDYRRLNTRLLGVNYRFPLATGPNQEYQPSRARGVRVFEVKLDSAFRRRYFSTPSGYVRLYWA